MNRPATVVLSCPSTAGRAEHRLWTWYVDDRLSGMTGLDCRVVQGSTCPGDIIRTSTEFDSLVIQEALRALWVRWSCGRMS